MWMLRTIPEKEKMERNAFCVWNVSGTARKTLFDKNVNYDKAGEIIKTAILQSQYDAARSVNEKQLMLYYGIGKYISRNSRKGFWGKRAIDAISERLDKELPGLRGFSSRNLRNMRTFYEEWILSKLSGILAEHNDIQH